ncbi:MAG: tRNA-dihydrouridine synthase [Deltaproteobacteria bacterium]|nr:tRNA-dihydrouridine synthase [Deltaproteobacteria bacterium]
MGLEIGNLKLADRAIQGALSGFSDLPMRRVARAFGCVYAMNEVVLDELVVLPGKLQQKILHVEDDDHPVCGQLLGAVPETFAAAAALLVDAGYDVVDVNMGCPVKKVLGRSRGGFLLSEPRTALEIVARVRDAVRPEVPVTVKMRRGVDDSALAEDMFWEILEGVFARGVAAVCVHGRTVAQRYVGPARRSFLTEVKKRHPSRVILGSGDLFVADDVNALLTETGVDGAWIARGAIGAPWIFSEVRHLLATGALPPPPSFAEQRRAVWLHHRECVALHGRELGNRLFRKVAIKYAEAHAASDDVLRACFEAKVPRDVEALLARWYDESLAEDHFGPVVRKTGSGHLVAAGACA